MKTPSPSEWKKMSLEEKVDWLFYNLVVAKIKQNRKNRKGVQMKIIIDLKMMSVLIEGEGGSSNSPNLNKKEILDLVKRQLDTNSQKEQE